VRISITIYYWTEANKLLKVQKYRIANNVDENSTLSLEELPKALNQINQPFLIVYMQ